VENTQKLMATLKISSPKIQQGVTLFLTGCGYMVNGCDIVAKALAKSQTVSLLETSSTTQLGRRRVRGASESKPDETAILKSLQSELQAVRSQVRPYPFEKYCSLLCIYFS
jgi:hypothetical protein